MPFRIVLLLALTALATPLHAGVKVSGEPCGDRFEIVAEQASLSDVLKRLSDAAGFELRFDPAADRVVDFNQRGQTARLLKALMGQTSFVALEDVDPACGEGRFIRQVWVLPRGTGVDYVEYRPEPRPRPAIRITEPLPPPPPVDPLPRGLRNKAGGDRSTLNRLREKAKSGEIVADPETGRAVDRETIEDHEAEDEEE
ncbi:MAG: hypothetical protein R3217_09670 [Gammaproteobacteria bacterium]|nr:hypothetical protein [Gammaproteobacteria bacterium]